MNHDASHCSDYKANICPEDCYRAQLTKDLKLHGDKFGYRDMSFAKFYGTKFCKLNPGKTWNLKGDKK